MTSEKIIEIARRYGNSDLRWVPVFENDEDIGISKREYVWEISQDSLIAFVQSILEAEREARKLTDKDIDDVIQSQCWAYGFDANAYPFARAIECRINREEE